MNKKEISEIRRNFSLDSGLCTINSVNMTFVDAEKQIQYNKNRSFILMDEAECDVCIKTLKKVISTNVGKNFIEYAFPKGAYEPDGAQTMLYKLLNTKLQDTDITSEYINYIVENYSIAGPYAIMIAHCTYTVFKKNSADEEDKYSEELFNFIVLAVCPAHTGDYGFTFSDNSIMKAVNSELVIDQKPTDGFMFPVFNDRSTDINHVMYYSKSAKDLNISMIENVLGCEFTLTPEQERLYFQRIISDIMGSDLSYQLIQAVNNLLRDMICENTHNTEPVLVNSHLIEELLGACNVSQDRLSTVHDIYELYCGTASLSATNLVDNKWLFADFSG